METAQKVYNSWDLAQDRQGKKLSHAVITALEETDKEEMGETDQKQGFRVSLALFDGALHVDLF